MPCPDLPHKMGPAEEGKGGRVDTTSPLGDSNCMV